MGPPGRDHLHNELTQLGGRPGCKNGGKSAKSHLFIPRSFWLCIVRAGYRAHSSSAPKCGDFQAARLFLGRLIWRPLCRRDEYVGGIPAALTPWARCGGRDAVASVLCPGSPNRSELRVRYAATRPRGFNSAPVFFPAAKIDAQGQTVANHRRWLLVAT